MALRALQGPAGGAAPVGGSGNLNTIPRWTGATTLGDSGITDNGTVIGVANGARTVTLNLLQISGNTLGTSTAELALQYGTSRDVIAYWGSSSIGLCVKGTSGNVGIGTAAPVGRADIAGANVDQLAWGLLSVRSNDAQGADKGGSIAFGGIYDASNTTHWAQISGRKENGTSGQYGGYLAFATRTNGAGVNTERARIDSSGNVILNAANTGATIQAAGTSQGLKLPATPGNTDPNTLDAYNQNTTWSPVVTWGTGGTVTTTSATGAYTQIGNVVTFTVTIAYNCSVIPTGGSISIDLPRASATGFNQRPGLWAFNAWNGQAGSNFLSIGSASTTATLRVANATGTADIATYLTVTASGALVVTATYLAS